MKNFFVKPKQERFLWIPVIIATLIIYLPALNGSFLHWDDDIYILNNPLIHELSWDNIRSIFSGFSYGLYHPLTDLSWAIEHHFVGLSPKLFHFDNLLLHLINTFLVFRLFFRYMVKNINVAVVASLLFGICTLHVESVAWITERKDVLYTFFFLISMIHYIKYSDTRKSKYFIYSLLFFVFSLLSKGMAVTLPIILIAIDYLNRRKLLNGKLILEKIPFLLLAVFFGIKNIQAQVDYYGVREKIYSFGEQAALSSYSYVQYLVKTVIPYNLSAFHPYPQKVDGHIPGSYWLYLIPLGLIIALIIYLYNKKRFVVFGILFFSINILLVLQLFMHNTEALISERYSYLPSLGIFIIIAQIYRVIYENKVKFSKGILFLFIAYSVALTYFTFERSKVWENDLTLFTDVLEKYPDSHIASNNVGMAYVRMNKFEEAKQYFDKTIEINPLYDEAYSNRGVVLIRSQNAPEEALKDFNKAIELNPKKADYYTSRGNAHYQMKDFDAAIKDFDTCLKLNPQDVDTWIKRGEINCLQGHFEKASNDFNAAVRIDGKMSTLVSNTKLKYANELNNEGIKHGKLGDYEKAMSYFKNALVLVPNHEGALNNKKIAEKKRTEIE